MIIDAGLEEADWIVCGVETLEIVDAGEVELDLEPNWDIGPAVAKLNALGEILVETGVDVIVDVVFVERDEILNCGKVGDTGRCELEFDADAVPGVNGVGPDFSCVFKRDDGTAATAGVDVKVESALMIGMSLILGDGEEDVERLLDVIWPSPRFTWNIFIEGD